MTSGLYLTVDELIALHDEQTLLTVARVGGFNSSAGPAIDRDRLQTQIDRAQSVIEGYVLARFPGLVNLATADMPKSLKGAASDLVIYWLRDRVGDAGSVDDTTRERYRDIIDWLKAIRDGKSDLGAGLTGLASGGGTTDRVLGTFPESRASSALEGYR